MAPSNKAKAAGVSASSFLDLKSEVARADEEFAKAKASGKALAATVVKRSGKKPPKWAVPNKGVHARASRDVELEEISRPTLDASYAQLQRKSQIYEKLSKGKSGGLNEKQYDALLVDFDSKPTGDYESDSDDVDESLTVPRPVDDDDPVIEYEDEFGRVRTGRRSEIPRHLLEPEEPPEEDFDPYVIHNPVDHFPTYEPSAERIASIQAKLAEEDNPLNMHYDSSREVRAKGAGFYQFSGDEETRRQQMEELKKARDETEKTRMDLGAVDLRPGEVEGLQPQGEADVAAAVPAKSRATEKRKRELEERRKLLEAKRRKKDPAAAPASPGPSSSIPSVPSASVSVVAEHVDPAPAENDPFAALEAQAIKKKARQQPQEKRPAKPANAADAFLASLEHDILGGMKR